MWRKNASEMIVLARCSQGDRELIVGSGTATVEIRDGRSQRIRMADMASLMVTVVGERGEEGIVTRGGCTLTIWAEAVVVRATGHEDIESFR